MEEERQSIYFDNEECDATHAILTTEPPINLSKVLVQTAETEPYPTKVRFILIFS